MNIIVVRLTEIASLIALTVVCVDFSIIRHNDENIIPFFIEWLELLRLI